MDMPTSNFYSDDILSKSRYTLYDVADYIKTMNMYRLSTYDDEVRYYKNNRSKMKSNIKKMIERSDITPQDIIDVIPTIIKVDYKDMGIIPYIYNHTLIIPYHKQIISSIIYGKRYKDIYFCYIMNIDALKHIKSIYEKNRIEVTPYLDDIILDLLNEYQYLHVARDIVVTLGYYPEIGIDTLDDTMDDYLHDFKNSREIRNILESWNTEFAENTSVLNFFTHGGYQTESLMLLRDICIVADIWDYNVDSMSIYDFFI